jgi:hypothetical protein
MRENKELRKEASTYRLQAERTLAQLNKVAPDIASSVVGTKRALQEKENTPGYDVGRRGGYKVHTNSRGTSIEMY